MLALAAVFLVCLYVIGLRADRIHAGRTVTEPGLSTAIPMKARRDGGTSARVSAAVPGSVTVTVPARYAGKTAHQWHRVAYLQQQRIKSLKRALLTSPSVSEAINLAATVYGNGATLWRKARCESNLNPNARNASGSSGLFQFLPSTWATTPFARYSIFSSYANALAAGWMHAQGRGGEWQCR